MVCYGIFWSGQLYFVKTGLIINAFYQCAWERREVRDQQLPLG